MIIPFFMFVFSYFTALPSNKIIDSHKIESIALAICITWFAVLGLNVVYGLFAVETVQSSNIANLLSAQWLWFVSGESMSLVPSVLGYMLSTNICLLLNSVHTITLSSLDVIHAYCIPSLNVKLDSLPLRITSLSVNSVLPGTYSGQCSELCGSGHASMPVNIVVL